MGSMRFSTLCGRTPSVRLLAAQYVPGRGRPPGHGVHGRAGCSPVQAHSSSGHPSTVPKYLPGRCLSTVCTMCTRTQAVFE